jgi:fructose-bisphosphate aldolase, class II
MRVASTGAIRKHFVEDRINFNPRKFYMAATQAMQFICAHRYEAIGFAGMASKIGKVYVLEAMQRRYDKFELLPQLSL